MSEENQSPHLEIEDLTDGKHIPSVEQMQSAMNALMTFVMYYYQSLRESGRSVQESKEIVAKEILVLYDKYAAVSGVKFTPNRVTNPLTLLDEIIAEVKAMGPQARSTYMKIVDFKRLIDQSKGDK